MKEWRLREIKNLIKDTSNKEETTRSGLIFTMTSVSISLVLVALNIQQAINVYVITLNGGSNI